MTGLRREAPCPLRPPTGHPSRSHQRAPRHTDTPQPWPNGTTRVKPQPRRHRKRRYTAWSVANPNGTGVPYRGCAGWVDYRHPIEALIRDAQGRILAALTRTDAELTLRGLAQLAEVSPTHVSRVMPRLVELGVVYRRDIGGTALFRLVDASLAARCGPWLGLASSSLPSSARPPRSSSPGPTT
jgi:hypothetical protein